MLISVHVRMKGSMKDDTTLLGRGDLLENYFSNSVLFHDLNSCLLPTDLGVIARDPSDRL